MVKTKVQRIVNETADDIEESYVLLPTEEGAEPKIDRREELFKKIGSAFFFGFTSFLLTVVNKTVLTTWHFPSFLVISVGQLAAAVILLYIAKLAKIISFPDFSLDVSKKMMPLPMFHFGNMVSGLGGTQMMPLPMFTAFRQFSILITMLLELKVLGIIPSFSVQISVMVMIIGALVAAYDDLTFTIEGYSYVMLANIMTAGYGVYIKQKLDTVDIGKYGIMFYNSMLMIVPAILLAFFTGDMYSALKFQHWLNPWFLIQFITSCCMGFVLTYSTFLCTYYNSALTTAMVGCFKNVFIAYLGMFIGGDYIFSWMNYIGVNISVFGSIYYTYIIATKKTTPSKVPEQSEEQI